VKGAPLVGRRPVSETASTLVIEVIDIEGHCPMYRVGDRCRVEGGYKVVSEGALCMHALQAVAPCHAALSRGVSPSALGLSGPDGAAYVQCLDAHRYTGGGTVTFRIGSEDAA
jgi:uncharacterized repeat protein (TIGR04076 family)